VSQLAVRRVFAMDEARFGLKATHRRLWCPFGSRPPWPHEHQYHWFWLYAAVEPVSGSHISGKVHWPDGIRKIALPSYSPELNPAERWFEALRRVFANAIFDTLEDFEAALTEALRPYWQNPAKLQHLIGYPWWCSAIADLNTTGTHSAGK